MNLPCRTAPFAVIATLVLALSSVSSAQFGPPEALATGVGWVTGLVADDVNQDGTTDFVVLTLLDNRVTLYLGQGAGMYVPQILTTFQGGPNSMQLGDLDDDGNRDLIVTTVGGVWWMRNQGAGSFANPLQVSGVQSGLLAVADVNGDGDLDIVVQSATIPGIQYFENNGSGMFQPPIGISTTPFGAAESICVTDLDGDGDAELLRGDINGTDYLYLNMGAAGFSTGTALSGSHEFFAPGDVNGDGLVDLVGTSYWGDGLGQWTNMGGGAFSPLTLTPPTFFSGAKPLLEDFDGDGDLDVVCDVDLIGGFRYFLNDGTGVFTSIGSLAEGFQGDNPVAVDMDGDQDLDILQVNSANGAIFWLENQHNLGVEYCAGLPNSVGTGADLQASGSRSAAANRLTLTASGLPPGVFGYFLNSRFQGTTMIPGSSGLLCLTTSIGRYNQPSEVRLSTPAGTMHLELDLSATPTPTGPVTILVGQSWSFQAWYRDFDFGPTNNFTGAIEINFVP